MSTTSKLFLFYCMTTAVVFLALSASAKAEYLKLINGNSKEFQEIIYVAGEKWREKDGGGARGSFASGNSFKDSDGKVLRLFTGNAWENYNDYAYDPYFKTTTLNDLDVYTDLQKTQIQSLFDHVYTKAYNTDNSIANQLYARAFDMAIWEIIADSGNLGCLTGNVQYVLAGYIREDGSTTFGTGPFYDTPNSAQYLKYYDLLESWYDAIENDTWDLLAGYDYDPVEVTAWTSRFGSVLLGVDNRSITPEPATLLITGLGITGVAVARRYRNKR